MQTSSLGRLKKSSLEHSDCFYVAFILKWRVRKPLTNNFPSPQSYFQTNDQSVIPMPLKSIEKHWCNMFFECNFADLGHVFVHWVN